MLIRVSVRESKQLVSLEIIDRAIKRRKVADARNRAVGESCEKCYEYLTFRGCCSPGNRNRYILMKLDFNFVSLRPR